MPHHTAAPDDLEEQVEVGFEQLDDAEAVNLGRAWVLLKPDLKCSAPARGRVTEVNGKGNDEAMKVKEPGGGFVVNVGLVVADVASGGGGGGLFAEGLEAVEEIGRGDTDVYLRDGMGWLGDGSESVLDRGVDVDGIEGDA